MSSKSLNYFLEAACSNCSLIVSVIPCKQAAILSSSRTGFAASLTYFWMDISMAFCSQKESAFLPCGVFVSLVCIQRVYFKNSKKSMASFQLSRNISWRRIGCIFFRTIPEPGFGVWPEPRPSFRSSPLSCLLPRQWGCRHLANKEPCS